MAKKLNSGLSPTLALRKGVAQRAAAKSTKELEQNEEQQKQLQNYIEGYSTEANTTLSAGELQRRNEMVNQLTQSKAVLQQQQKQLSEQQQQAKQEVKDWHYKEKTYGALLADEWRKKGVAESRQNDQEVTDRSAQNRSSQLFSDDEPNGSPMHRKNR